MLKVRAIVACDHPGCGAQYETEISLGPGGDWAPLTPAPQGWSSDTCPRHSSGEDWTELPTRNDGPQR